MKICIYKACFGLLVNSKQCNLPL